jgi:hypothetical protein
VCGERLGGLVCPKEFVVAGGRKIMKRNILLFTVLSVVVTTRAMPKTPSIVDLALQGIGTGPVEKLKGRIFSRPITVLGAEDHRRAISSLSSSIRNRRIQEGKLLRRVERITSPLLELHNQRNKVELFLYRDDYPRAMVWQGCILTISDSLADRLYDEELAGIVAHKLGHAYFTAEILEARKNKDEQAMRMVELKCDVLPEFGHITMFQSLRAQSCPKFLPPRIGSCRISDSYKVSTSELACALHLNAS